MIRLCLVVCALIIVGLSGCTPRYPGCKNDGHCRDLERCQGGRCELPQSGPALAQSSTAMLKMMHTACDGGNLRSCMILGRQYLAGRRAPKDRQKAMGCFNKACDGGQAEGCALAGRATPHSASIRGALPGGLRLSQFTGVSIGKIGGPDGESVRAALKEPLEASCKCITGSGNDMDFLEKGELLITGNVLRRTASTIGGKGVEVKEGDDLASLVKDASSQPSSSLATEKMPGQCKGTAIVAKFWLVYTANRQRPLPVLVVGRAPAGQCRVSMEAAIEDLAAGLMALLNDTFSRKAILFKDPAVPLLEQGNNWARQGNWKQALALYDKALARAGGQGIPAESRGHALYSRGLALANLGQYGEAYSVLKQAHQANPVNHYLAEVERLSVVGSKAWTAPPPVDRQAGKSKKGRRPYWRPGLKRKIVWE